jgi:hypothetical protein
MHRPKCVLGVIVLWSACFAFAQTPTPPAAVEKPSATDKPADTAPAAPAAPVWSVGPIDFSGLVDGYYSLNFNHPSSQANNLYNFDVKANQFSLNMAKLSMGHTADPVGFQIDFGFGARLRLCMAANRLPASSATSNRPS